MTVADYAVHIALTIFLIVGIYQFYFWSQRNARGRPRHLATALDDLIPFQPGWVWVYSGLYYPIIVLTNLSIQSSRHFARVAVSYIVLLLAQMICFAVFPVATPEEWRRYPAGPTLTERLLAFVHSFDGRLNCFPSMHTSVAMLTAMHLNPSIGGWAWLFPVMISVSCLFTKQHFVVDIPAGAVLGWTVFLLYARVLA